MDSGTDSNTPRHRETGGAVCAAQVLQVQHLRFRPAAVQAQPGGGQSGRVHHGGHVDAADQTVVSVTLVSSDGRKTAVTVRSSTRMVRMLRFQSSAL